MTYDEAEEKALSVKWKVDMCSQGKECWCRLIMPEEDITYTNSLGNSYVYSLVDSGAVSKELAERIVDDHNLIIIQGEFSKRINGGTYISLSERIKQQDNG